MSFLAGIFDEGPKGRTISVDASGSITSTEGGGLFLPYAFGPKGRPITVDGSGRLHITLTTPAELTNSTAASGAFDLGQSKRFDILVNEELVFTNLLNPAPGSEYVFIFEQAASGGGLGVTFPANVLWPGGTAPTLTSASGSIDKVRLLYRERDDTFLGDFDLDYS